MKNFLEYTRSYIIKDNCDNNQDKTITNCFRFFDISETRFLTAYKKHIHSVTKCNIFTKSYKVQTF